MRDFIGQACTKKFFLYVNKCQNCLKRKSTPDVAPLQPIVANQPMELVHMDFLSIETSVM